MMLSLDSCLREKACWRIPHINFNGLIKNGAFEKQGAGIWITATTYRTCMS